jgi:carboxyl-terminal processing protease
MRGLKWLSSSAAGLAVLWSAMPGAADLQDRPAFVAGHSVPAVQGVWRSRGYGYLLQIDEDRPKLFHVAGDFCYADPRPEPDPDDLFVFYRPLDPDTIAFSEVPGQTRYVFDRLQDLPEQCAEEAAWSRPRIAALVAATFADLYPSFARRGIDWQSRTAALATRFNEIADDAGLFKALEALLSGIEDPHVELRAEIDGERRELSPGQAETLRRIRATPGLGKDPRARERRWFRAYRRGIRQAVLERKAHKGVEGRVIWGRAGDIGYLNVLDLEAPEEDSAFDDALDRAIASFQSARAVIVDISRNLGGEDRIGQRIAGRFAAVPRFAYTKVAFGARGVEPQAFFVEPSEGPRYLGPVYLLTSDVTLSAGEILALFMRSLPNVVHVGESTRGAFSDEIEKPLPNGWTLELSGEVYRDPDGQDYETKGLPPQVRRDVFPADDPLQGHARCVLSLMDAIRRDDPDIWPNRR